MNHALADLQDLQFTTKELVDRLRTLCGDDEEAFLDTLDGEADTTEAARRVVRWMNEQEAQAEAMKGLSDTYAARAKVLMNRKDGARNALFHFLEYLGVKSMQLPEATISVRVGTESLIGDDNAIGLPEDLVRTKRFPDRKKIFEALKAGREVSGFSISNGEPGLSVRVR